MTTYRESHRSQGYGEVYDQTYERGYYRVQWERIERPLLRAALDRAHTSGARRALDFACGTGRILAESESIFPESWGVDVSETMVERAIARCPRSRILLQDITASPLPVRFDVITGFRFFLNAEPELQRSAARCLAEHLVPGGFLLVNVHVNRSSPLGVAYRVRNHSRLWPRANTMGYEGMSNLLSEAGLEVESVAWYSFLPRLGWRASWLATALLVPLDKTAGHLPIALQRWAQSFMVVARKP